MAGRLGCCGEAPATSRTWILMLEHACGRRKPPPITLRQALRIRHGAHWCLSRGTATAWSQHFSCSQSFVQVAGPLSLLCQLQVVPPAWLRLFSTTELRQLLSGGEDGSVEVADLKAHAVYSGGYTAGSRPVALFWSVSPAACPGRIALHSPWHLMTRGKGPA